MKAFKGLEKDLTCRGFQTALLEQLIDDFNEYSNKLVTLGCAQSKDEKVFQWYSGNMNCIEEYMKELANLMGVKLIYIVHDIKYRTVKIGEEG